MNDIQLHRWCVNLWWL